MAKKKVDIVAEGRAASVAGSNVNPYHGGSWQSDSWFEGWKDGEDDKALAKQAIYDEAVKFKIVKTPVVAPRRKVRDAMRRMESIGAKLAHNAKMRKLDNDLKNMQRRQRAF